MIPFPAVTALLDKHGTDATGRQKVRDVIADAIRAEGKRRIEKALGEAGRSMKCAGAGGIATPRHADTDDGCANDGSTCICRCHDPVEVS